VVLSNEIIETEKNDALIDSNNLDVLKLESITIDNAANTTCLCSVSSELDPREDLPKLKIS